MTLVKLTHADGKEEVWVNIDNITTITIIEKRQKVYVGNTLINFGANSQAVFEDINTVVKIIKDAQDKPAADQPAPPQEELKDPNSKGITAISRSRSGAKN